ncbi:MAG: hypothetical protein U0836_10690 [Pirellulales bacterium]
MNKSLAQTSPSVRASRVAAVVQRNIESINRNKRQLERSKSREADRRPTVFALST